jgi:hypothetical protein
MIISLIPRSRLQHHRLGTFAWPEALDPATWTGFRVTGDEVNRRLDEVAPKEIANAMLALVTGTEPLGEDDLLRATAEIFGIGRLSTHIRSRLEAVATILKKDGRLWYE